MSSEKADADAGHVRCGSLTLLQNLEAEQMAATVAIGLGHTKTRLWQRVRGCTALVRRPDDADWYTPSTNRTAADCAGQPLDVSASSATLDELPRLVRQASAGTNYEPKVATGTRSAYSLTTGSNRTLTLEGSGYVRERLEEVRVRAWRKLVPDVEHPDDVEVRLDSENGVMLRHFSG